MTRIAGNLHVTRFITLSLYHFITAAPIRSCYDLEMHSQKTGVAMLASCKLDEPKVVTEYKLQVDRKILGKTFKAEQKKVGYKLYFQPADMRWMDG